MKIFLDNCVDWRLARDLSTHTVVHARELGWEALTNGRLLKAASEQGFDVILTVDKNFRFQQNLEGKRVSVVTLAPLFTRLDQLRPLVPRTLDLLDRIEPGTFATISEA